jgi:hypothetical protein
VQPETREEPKSASTDERPAAATEGGSKLPAGDGLTTAATNPAPDTSSDNNSEPTKPSITAVPPADVNANPPAPTNGPDQTIAIVLAQGEIRTVSELANKVIAIDGSHSDHSVASVKNAIVSAGATQVQMSEDGKLALIRLMDGEVQAAVVDVVSSPDPAAAWNKGGLDGFSLFRIPLPSE